MKLADIEKQIHVWEKTYGLLPFWAVVIGSGLLLIGINLWADWRMVKRMGYPGIFSAFLGMPLFWLGLAFWRWPNQKG